MSTPPDVNDYITVAVVTLVLMALAGVVWGIAIRRDASRRPPDD